MPAFAALFVGVLARFWTYLVTTWGIKVATRIAVVLVLAGLYVSLLVAYNSVVRPLISQLFATPYGQVIGLAFPPIAGTVVAALSALWVARIGYDYLERFGLVLAKV